MLSVQSSILPRWSRHFNVLDYLPPLGSRTASNGRQSYSLRISSLFATNRHSHTTSGDLPWLSLERNAAIKQARLLRALPTSCPGCGALAQNVRPENEAGFYDFGRKSVKAFVASTVGTEMEGFENDKAALDRSNDHTNAVVASELGALNSANSVKPHQIEDMSHDLGLQLKKEAPLPVCNRCHHLLHHQRGPPTIHPSLNTLQQVINESPHAYNHIYHVLDAADFPLSLVTQLQKRLALIPQRSQNRRAKNRKFYRGSQAEMSFIITRSDLLAPQKEQVDRLMPYLCQVLRDALGSFGRAIRLGNIRCVSAKRGWWTKQIKEDIWSRGGGGWLVGKVNVGKSSLFESVFPKGRKMDHKIRSMRDNNGSRISESLASIAIPTEGSLLPSAQPESQYPVMPIVSSLPGTTVSPIRLSFGGGKGELVDLPGLPRASLEDHVVQSHKRALVMDQRIKPQQHVIKPGQSLVIAGLICITSTTPNVTILAYPFLPLDAHVTSIEKARTLIFQIQPSGVPIVAEPGVGQKMALAGRFSLRWDVTKQRSGPLTSSTAAGLSTKVLPFVVYSTDILVEGCGWVELVAQVRKKDLEVRATDAQSSELKNLFPAVDIWSPNGDYIGARRPMNGWLLNRPRLDTTSQRKRPRRSMKGVKRGMKIANQSVAAR